jgi:hypothetical protein
MLFYSVFGLCRFMQVSQYFYINTQDCWVKLPSNLWFQKFQLEACINNSFQFNTKFYLFSRRWNRIYDILVLNITLLPTLTSSHSVSLMIIDLVKSEKINLFTYIFFCRKYRQYIFYIKKYYYVSCVICTYQYIYCIWDQVVKT